MMRRWLPAPLLLVLAGCGEAPMPPPAAGEAPKQDAVEPADVTAQDMAGASAQAAPPDALPPPELGPSKAVANAPGTPDRWAGTWTGPEGTSLKIVRQEVGYELTVTNLDGPRVFHGIATDDALQFERDGVAETVRAGNGKATGMKWLAGKQDCLVVHPGEGYCRD
jgi:hypothetical protein